MGVKCNMGLDVRTVRDEDCGMVARRASGGPGSVFRRFKTVARGSETDGAGGAFVDVCDVAEAAVVDVIALLCSGGSERGAGVPRSVFRRFGMVVRRSETTGVHDAENVVCDVAGTEVDDGDALLRR